MPERRYSRYKQEDVWIQLVHLQARLHIELVAGSVYGNSVSLLRGGQEYRAVVLVRASDWYYYSLNCTDRFKHGITCVVCGTHDSCIDRLVLAMDTLRWYEPKKMRADFGKLQPDFDANNQPIPDTFDQKRKTQYGHNMLIGALMQRREDALARLATLKTSTRLRIEAEVRKLQRRRVGRPIEVWPVERSKERNQYAKTSELRGAPARGATATA
ncbi:MAG: hypothetical protein J2P36_12255 [Ktedonobacteraceae bacterium]|nr:hypothetical protein [Ktedonobacteraceae bacterium]